MQNGWKRTTSADSFNVNVQSGSIFSGKDFGNFQLGILSGIAFEDLNGNAVKDNGEPGLQGRTIHLNNTADSSTNANGVYKFTNLTVGTYTITEEPITDWIQTFPGNNQGYSIPVISGTNDSTKHFGNFKLGSISGLKFNDVNGNGIYESGNGELPLSNWTIKISGPTNDSVTTGNDGSYSFPELAGGTYTISERLKNGWFQTLPNSGSYAITMRSRLDTTNILFGNYQLGTISGKIFNDINNNSIQDNSEPGAANIKVRIFGSFSDTTTTDANGNYTFSNVRIGDYTVAQIIPSGWIQTFPVSNGTYSFHVSSAQTIAQMFYNATSFNQDLSHWCVANIPTPFES